MNAIICTYYSSPEIYPPDPPDAIESLEGHHYLLWKLRDYVRTGTPITLSAQHRFAGTAGSLKFLVYNGKDEHDGKLQLAFESPEFSAAQAAEWSRWTFTANAPILFVGFAWQSTELPVVIQEHYWRDPTLLNNYAYDGKKPSQVIKLRRPYTPTRANFIVEFPTSDFWQPRLWASSCFILAIVIGSLLYYQRQVPQPLELTYGVAGIVLALRGWASYGGFDWVWGAHYLWFLPESLRIVLLAGIVFSCFMSLFVSERWLAWKFSDSLPRYVLLILFAVFFAWEFQNIRIYHDWIYSITNYHHAPLSSAVYHAALFALRDWAMAAMNLPKLFSLGMLIGYLLVLRCFLRYYDPELKIPLLGFIFFFSFSTTQVFLGYIGVHSLPIFFWMALLYTAIRTLDGKSGLFVPTLVAFLAYLAHVSEAVLIFSVLYLWFHQIFVSKRVTLHTATVTAIALMLMAFGITAIMFATLYFTVFETDISKYQSAFTHYGLEILWGKIHHAGLMLPVFDPMVGGAYTPPGPRYAMFSLDNLIRTLNFPLHYSHFSFLLPIGFIIQGKGKDLRDPRISFAFVSFIAYTVYMFVAYVGWIPVMRDWELFGIFAAISGGLLYLLLLRRSQPQALLLVTMINLLQTLPWIYLNHYPHDLPW